MSRNRDGIRRGRPGRIDCEIEVGVVGIPCMRVCLVIPVELLPLHTPRRAYFELSVSVERGTPT